jgi:orotate phosphoribosyltransferase-like protein
MSGALIGPPVALRLNKSMILVRKDEDDTHSDYKVEGDRNIKRYVILDDFVCSGKTRDRIINGVKGFAEGATYLGLLPVTFIDDGHIRMCHENGGLYPLK